MILKKKDEKKERETNRGNVKKRLICYRLQKKKLEAERPLFFNEDTLQSVERPTGTSSTKNEFLD